MPKLPKIKGKNNLTANPPFIATPKRDSEAAGPKSKGKRDRTGRQANADGRRRKDFCPADPASLCELRRDRPALSLPKSYQTKMFLTFNQRNKRYQHRGPYEKASRVIAAKLEERRRERLQFLPEHLTLSPWAKGVVRAKYFSKWQRSMPLRVCACLRVSAVKNFISAKASEQIGRTKTVMPFGQYLYDFFMLGQGGRA